MAARTKWSIILRLSISFLFSLTMALPRNRRQVPGMGGVFGTAGMMGGQPFQYQAAPPQFQGLNMGVQMGSMGQQTGRQFGMAGPRMIMMGSEVEPTQAPDIEQAEGAVMGMPPMAGMGVQNGMFPRMPLNPNQMPPFLGQQFANSQASLLGFPVNNAFPQARRMAMMNPGVEVEPTQLPDVEPPEGQMYPNMNMQPSFGMNRISPNLFNPAANAGIFPNPPSSQVGSPNLPNMAGIQPANPTEIPFMRNPMGVVPPVPVPQPNTLPALPPQAANKNPALPTQAANNGQALPPHTANNQQATPSQAANNKQATPSQPAGNIQATPPSNVPQQGPSQASPQPQSPGISQAGVKSSGHPVSRAPPSVGEVEPPQPPEVEAPEVAANTGNVVVKSQPYQPAQAPRGAPALGTNPLSRPKWRGMLF